MSYKLTFNLENATLGDFAKFVEDAQSLGVPGSAVLEVHDGHVSVEVGTTADAADTAGTAAGRASELDRNVDNFVREIKDTVRQGARSNNVPVEAVVDDLLLSLKTFSESFRQGLRNNNPGSAGNPGSPPRN